MLSRSIAWPLPRASSLGIALHAGSQVQYRCDVTAARAQLSEATWDAAWAQGQQLTLEQAVADALAERDDAPAQPEAARGQETRSTPRNTLPGA